MADFCRRGLFAAGGTVYGVALAIAVFELWQGRPLLAVLAMMGGLAAIAVWAAWYGSWGHAAAVVRRRHERERRRAQERALDVSRL